MLAGAALRKTGSSWKFASEAALEDFVWHNLKQLSGLIPLKRQYAVKGEICDILALNETRQLVILELKNAEDRYIVQQLTRYYENLLDEKPFAEQIDYNQPVRLIAAAPSFHRHKGLPKNKLFQEKQETVFIKNDNHFKGEKRGCPRQPLFSPSSMHEESIHLSSALKLNSVKLVCFVAK